MMLTVYYKLIIKFYDVDTKTPSTSELVTKTQYDSDRRGLEKKIKNIDKKILVGCSERLIRTQKLQRLETKYLVLLD